MRQTDVFIFAEFLKEGFDAYYDVCIIGGGVMGCAAAYFLAQKVYKGLKICVVEKDSTVSDGIFTVCPDFFRQKAQIWQFLLKYFFKILVIFTT